MINICTYLQFMCYYLGHIVVSLVLSSPSHPSALPLFPCHHSSYQNMHAATLEFVFVLVLKQIVLPVCLRHHDGWGISLALPSGVNAGAWQTSGCCQLVVSLLWAQIFAQMKQLEWQKWQITLTCSVTHCISQCEFVCVFMLKARVELYLIFHNS